MTDKKLYIKNSVDLDTVKNELGLEYRVFGSRQYLMQKEKRFSTSFKIACDTREILSIAGNYTSMIILFDLIQLNYVEKRTLNDEDKLNKKIDALRKQIEKLEQRKSGGN